MARPGPPPEARPDATTTIDVAGDQLVPAWLQRLAAIGWRVLATLLVGAVFAAVGIYLSTVTAAILVGVIVVATFGPFEHRRLFDRDVGWLCIAHQFDELAGYLPIYSGDARAIG